METCLLVLYVTLEQESAVRRLYKENGWTFDKIDYQLTEIEGVITKADIKGTQIHETEKIYLASGEGNIAKGTEKGTKTKQQKRPRSKLVKRDKLTHDIDVQETTQANNTLEKLEETNVKKKRKLKVAIKTPNELTEQQGNNTETTPESKHKTKDRQTCSRKTWYSMPTTESTCSETKANYVSEHVEYQNSSKDSNFRSCTVEGKLRVKIKPTDKNIKKVINDHRKTKRTKLKQAENVNENIEHVNKEESKSKAKQKRKPGSETKFNDVISEKTEDKTKNNVLVEYAGENTCSSVIKAEEGGKYLKPQTKIKSSEVNLTTVMATQEEQMGEKYPKGKHFVDSEKTNCKKSKIGNKDVADEASNNNKFSCPDCPRVYSWVKTYEKHRQRHNNQEFDCKECGKKFMNYRNLRAHMFNRSVQNTSFECDICKFKTSTACLMRKHRREKHPRQEIFQCHLCAKIIKTKSYLTVHLKESHQIDNSKYECHICGKKCQRQKNFTYHMAAHESENYDKNKCKICEKMCTTTRDLRSHMRVHKERKFLCSDCGKGFITKTKLEAHSRIHSGIKPYKCDKCSYCSTQAGNLRGHMKIHNKSPMNDSTKRSLSHSQDTHFTQPSGQTPGATHVGTLVGLNNNQGKNADVSTSQGHTVNVVPVLLEKQKTYSGPNQELVSKEVRNTEDEINTDAQHYPEYYKLYEDRSSSYARVVKNVACSESNVAGQQTSISTDTHQQALTDISSNALYRNGVATYPQHTDYSQVKYTEASSTVPIYVDSPNLDTRQPVYTVQGTDGQLIDQAVLNNPGYLESNSLAAPYIQHQTIPAEPNIPTVSHHGHVYSDGNLGIYSKPLTTVAATGASTATVSNLKQSESTQSALPKPNNILYGSQQIVYPETVQKFNQQTNLSDINPSGYPASTQNVPASTYSDPASNISVANTEQIKLQPVAKITDLSSDKLQMLVYAISNNSVATSYAISSNPVTTTSYATCISNNPVTTSYSIHISNSPVTTSYAISNNPVATSYATSNDVTTSYSVSNNSVTAFTILNNPVTTYAISNNPVTTSYAVSNNAITTTYTILNNPVSSYSISNTPVTSSYALLKSFVTTPYTTCISKNHMTTSYAISNTPIMTMTPSYSISNNPIMAMTTSYSISNNTLTTSHGNTVSHQTDRQTPSMQTPCSTIAFSEPTDGAFTRAKAMDTTSADIAEAGALNDGQTYAHTQQCLTDIYTSGI